MCSKDDEVKILDPAGLVLKTRANSPMLQSASKRFLGVLGYVRYGFLAGASYLKPGIMSNPSWATLEISTALDLEVQDY